MIRRRLLTILFICVLLPVVLVLFQSFHAMMTQRQMTTEMSGRYVRDLAAYAADLWDDGGYGRIQGLLSITDDHGYDKLISGPMADASDKSADELRKLTRISKKGKFVPGMVAYVTLSGRLLAHSRNAEILLSIFKKALEETGGRIVGADGHIVGKFRSNDDDITYVSYIAPTSNGRVYAVAAVTMLSWMGRNDFDTIKLAAAGITGMLICLVGLFLLRGSVIAPLRELSAQVDSLKWGRELPSEQPHRVGDLRVEEITSLKNAVRDLAARMIEKNELESRYVGDIIKAQETERGRIAQDIHDGPIQVVAALMQKIQIASLATGDDMSGEVAEQLRSSEEIADELVQDLRSICDSLVPPWVSLGLVSCIEESASRLERQHGITITTNIDQDIDLPQTTTLALFRIFQEAVSNAVRHGHATEVRVDASRCDDGCLFVVSDNGCGFDMNDKSGDELKRLGKRGLNGMRQRVDFLGGTCEITSTDDGTSISVKIPV